MEETRLQKQPADADWNTQRQFALRVRGLLGTQPKSAFIHTYGCQQNVSDSEKLAGMLAEMGYRTAKDAQDADLVLFNTCAVREHAEQRVFGNVGALKAAKARRPGMVLALCGCMASERHVAERVRAHFPYVDLVFGTGALPRFPELLWRVLSQRGRVFDQQEQEQVTEGLPVRRGGTLKAWLPVMQGCNNFCTYCIVPYVRGREHSRTPEHVLAEARQLVADGYKEITLLGQNVNSYGKDLGSGWDFARLLDAVCAIPGDFRIHFMTSHPKDASHRLLETIAANPKVSRRLHLPFQSGSDRILKAMNRGYTAAQYEALVKDARHTIPGLCLTSDVIVGFPGETEADFADTIALVERVGFANLYTFLYSKRRGTPAERMPDDTPHEEKTRRFARLLAAQGKSSRAFLDGMVGRTEHVLAETVENGVASGRVDSGMAVRFSAPQEAAGQYCDVRITAVQGVALLGESAGVRRAGRFEKMDVIEKARELSEVLAQDARCVRLQAARAAVETDAALGARTAAWNREKEHLGQLMRQTPRDAQAVAALQKQLSDEYDAIMTHPAMAELKAAQDALNALLSHINSLIQLAVSGETDTAECAGGCANCPGCH